MATPPTLSASSATVFNTGTSPKTSAAVSANVGDILVACVADENTDPSQAYTYSNSGTAQTWVKQTATGGTTDADAWAQTATAIVANTLTSQTISATFSAGGSGQWYGLAAYVFSGSDGVGASARTAATGGAASLAITTSFDNSALVVVCADWSAADGTSRVWRTVNGYTPTVGNGQEKAYFRDSAHYAAYSAYYPDAGTAGSKTVGLSTPSGGDFELAAVEIRGSAGGAAPIPPPLVMQTRRAY